MAAVAWSTAVLLVVLLPGFAFVFGMSTAEPFSRDTTPRSPLAQLAITVLVSLGAHAGLIFLCASFTLPTLIMGPFGWGIVPPISYVREVDLSVVLLALVPVNDTGSLGQLATNLASNTHRVFAYVVVSTALGFSLGNGLVAVATRTGKGTSIVSGHAWLYSAIRITERTVPVVHVLTSTTHGGKHLMYLGTLERFSLRADGKFAYLVLATPSKYSFDMKKRLKTSEPIAITGTRLGRELLYIDGESIANVFFGRVKPPPFSVEAQELDQAFAEAQLFEPESRGVQQIFAPVPFPGIGDPPKPSAQQPAPDGPLPPPNQAAAAEEAAAHEQAAPERPADPATEDAAPSPPAAPSP